MRSVRYPEEILDGHEDDGTMVESKQAFEQAVIGRRIVRVQEVEITYQRMPNYTTTATGTQLVLDDGRKVTLIDGGDCCAFTELQEFLLHPDKVQHAIAGVGTTDGYTTWHIFCDAGDIAALQVGWSCGNPFYYGYGFTIVVEDLDHEVTD